MGIYIVHKGETKQHTLLARRFPLLAKEDFRMWSFWGVLFLASYTFAAPTNGTEVPFVEPEVLERLLENGEYEEFSRLMRIEHVNLVIPRKGNEDPMYHKELPLGDVLVHKNQLEEGRVVINFDKYPGSKWPNGVVPYRIASSGYTAEQRNTIQSAINDFNAKNTGTRFVPRLLQRDYVMIFSGEGCYAVLGRTGNQQPLSLQSNGCVYKTTVQHEMMHALGFHHEQCRPDRDDSVRVLWENIPPEWHSQYEKLNADDFKTTTDYDYYSIMHYGMNAPGTGKRAFDILKSGIDESRIGNSDSMTDLDIQKIRNSYA